MVATKSKARSHDVEQQSSRKRQCCDRGTPTTCHNGDAAAEFLRRFDLSQGNPSPEQPIAQWAWRCFAEFNVLMRQHAGKLRDIPLCGYLSLSRAAKPAVFARLLEAEGVSYNTGQPWPMHVHTIACILQRFCFHWPQASLCRYTVKTPDWLAEEWCAKWGLGGLAEVTLFAVNVYDTTYEPMHIHGGELQSDVEQLNRTLFVPVIQ